MCTCVHVYVCVYMCVHMYVYVCVCMCMYVCVCMYVHVCVIVCSYWLTSRTHTHTPNEHALMHARTYTQTGFKLVVSVFTL